MKRNKKLKQKLFNDGKLDYGEVIPIRDEGTRKMTGESFNSLGSLFFSLESIRQGDFDQYGNKNQAVDLKLSTYFSLDIEKAHKIKIDNELYEITAIDPDKEKINMYWYLAKLGRLTDGIRFREDSQND